MYKIIEIIIIIVIVASSLILLIFNFRRELEGKCSCGYTCDSCKIKDNCLEKELNKQKLNKNKK